MTNRVLIGKLPHGEKKAGLYVSRMGADVLDSDESPPGRMSFDSSTYPLATLRVHQHGTFSITCTKTNMGKKGAMEVMSDEENRANSLYTAMYDWQLDPLKDEDKEVWENNEFPGPGGTGAFEGSGFAPEQVANVYCDYGKQVIEFNPPLASNIKTPHVSVFFALANSSGHFHPWYANVETHVAGQEDYEWRYANSQHCVHMDSVWFRGKWAFRERTSFAQSLYGEAVGAVGTFEPRQNLGVPVLPEHYVGSEYQIANPDESATIYEISDSGSHFEEGLSSANNSGIWGGMFKSFAGLQGMAYFANNTHLELNGFMTPTHTPTPFHRKREYFNQHHLPKFTITYMDGSQNSWYLREFNYSLTEFHKGSRSTAHDFNIGNRGRSYGEDRFLETHTHQGQPTGLDSFWNSFSNNMSQFVNANTPFGEFAYLEGGDKIPLNWDYHQGITMNNWYGGKSKNAIGTQGPRFGFGGAGSVEAVGPGGFDTYIGRYIVYDIQGGDSDG